MRYRLHSCFPLVVLMLLALPLPASAIPAITCHCFSDRSFDPARPDSADPYFLATAQNTFFADAFAVDKKTVIIKKQTGVPGDDLWVAYWLAAKSGRSPEALLDTKAAKGWDGAVASLGLGSVTLGPGFMAAVRARQPDGRLAEAVVNELFAEYRLLATKDVAAMRQAGATNQELILATLIAAKGGKPVLQVYREAKGGARSWGRLMQGVGLEPAGLKVEVSALLHRQR